MDNFCSENPGTVTKEDEPKKEAALVHVMASSVYDEPHFIINSDTQ